MIVATAAPAVAAVAAVAALVVRGVVWGDDVAAAVAVTFAMADRPEIVGAVCLGPTVVTIPTGGD